MEELTEHLRELAEQIRMRLAPLIIGMLAANNRIELNGEFVYPYSGSRLNFTLSNKTDFYNSDDFDHEVSVERLLEALSNSGTLTLRFEWTYITVLEGLIAFLRGFFLGHLTATIEIQLGENCILGISYLDASEAACMTLDPIDFSWPEQLRVRLAATAARWQQ